MSLSDERIRDEVLSRLAEGRGPMCTTFEGVILVRELQSLRASQAKVVEALREIRLTPSRPFPDAGAHSQRVFAEAVWRAWSDIQRIAALALAEHGGQT